MTEITEQVQQVKKGKPKYELSPEDFDRLLSVLDPDREIAGQEYLDLEKRLLIIFGRLINAEDLVDETLNRYCKKLKNMEGGAFSQKEQEEIEREKDERAKNAKRAEIASKVRNAIPYCIGIAKKIKQEEHNKRPIDPLPDNFSETWATPEPDPDPFADPLLVECYRKCLHTLPDDKRDMLISYREGETSEKISNRKSLAERLGMPQATLRKNIERWQGKLRECVEKCLKGKR